MQHLDYTDIVTGVDNVKHGHIDSFTFRFDLGGNLYTAVVERPAGQQTIDDDNPYEINTHHGTEDGPRMEHSYWEPWTDVEEAIRATLVTITRDAIIGRGDYPQFKPRGYESVDDWHEENAVYSKLSFRNRRDYVDSFGVAPGESVARETMDVELYGKLYQVEVGFQTEASTYFTLKLPDGLPFYHTVDTGAAHQSASRNREEISTGARNVIKSLPGGGNQRVEGVEDHFNFHQ